MRRVIVTRPASEAERWTQALQAHGWRVEGWPLIDIAAPKDRSSLEQAQRDGSAFDAVMFVSAAAVEHFLPAQACLPLPAMPAIGHQVPARRVRW